MPQGGATRTMIEKFDDRLQAFHRHAQVVMELRDFGWTVASYGR
jgi:glycerate kinase